VPRSLLLAVLAALIAGCREPPAGAALVDREPLPVAAIREVPAGEGGEAHMGRGLHAYGQGRWTAAVSELEAARLGVDGYRAVLVQLFLGSALRLSGRHERALGPLGLVADEARRTGATELLDLALYERAQALLGLGRPAEARQALREVGALGERRGEAAAAQLARVEALLARP